MKKVAVVCAAGKEGRLLVDEAVSRGYDVTGFVRGSDKVANPKAKTVVKDLFDLTREDLIRFDAVIDAFGAWTPETLPLHRTSLKHLCDVQWTYLSPAGDFVADGERTGEYLLGGEEYFVNDKGESRISYADYAIAMIDEIENANNIQKRFSVIGK